MAKMKTGVVVVTKFVDKQLELVKKYRSKQLQTFQSYIDYIDRPDAARNDNYQKYSMYNDYMSNPEKTSGLFTADKDRLSEDDIKALKQAFQTAYDNDSIMWQTVISFDNRFLAKQGIYIPATGKLDENQLQECTRNMMANALKREGIAESAIWSASIHYNTDNIHIHVATVEPIPTRKKCVLNGKERPRGMFRTKTISGMKSDVVNSLLQRDRSYVDELVRRRMVQGKRWQSSFDDFEMRKMFLEIYKKLPDDRRKWFYNYHDIAHLKSLIDKMSRYYIHTYHQDDFVEFQKIILEEQELFKAAYGGNGYEQYAENKMKDFYTRMGNAILTEMREYSKHEIKLDVKQLDIKAYNAQLLDRSVKKILYNLDSEWKQKQINQFEFESVNEI